MMYHAYQIVPGYILGKNSESIQSNILRIPGKNKQEKEEILLH